MNDDFPAEIVSNGPVVCFGVLSYLQLMVVDHVPIHNSGTPINRLTDSFGDDAGIVAWMLKQWGQEAWFIPSAVGADDLGDKVVRTVRDLGVPVDVEINPDVSTVAELSIADPSGARTYFYKRTPELLATLDSADLTPLTGASYLYLDWYDGSHIIRPMEIASQLGIKVFVNIESQHNNDELVSQLSAYADVFQVSLDGNFAIGDMESIVNKLLEVGIGTVIVTGGSMGCVVANARQIVRVVAPDIYTIDGNGAGSCFSAGFIYGSLRGWGIEQCARFATAQASIKCSTTGYEVDSVEEGKRLASFLISEIETAI